MKVEVSPFQWCSIYQVDSSAPRYFGVIVNICTDA